MGKQNAVLVTILFAMVVVAEGTHGATLMGGTQLAPSKVNLSSEGPADWAHWGKAGGSIFNYKRGVKRQISNYAKVGGQRPSASGYSTTRYSWAQGAPTATKTDARKGVRVTKVRSGFKITVPADRALRTLKVYYGVKQANGRLVAKLSDGSAPSYVAKVERKTDKRSYVSTLNFQASSSGQRLTIEYTLRKSHRSTGFIMLEAAALEGAGSSGATDSADNTPTTNNAPNAQTDAFVADQGESENFNVLSNDSGLDDGPIKVRIVSAPSNGSASALSDNRIRYTSDNDYLGPDGLLYEVSDSDGQISVASVDITVGCSSPPCTRTFRASWNPVSDPDVTGYCLYHDVQSGPPYADRRCFSKRTSRDWTLPVVTGKDFFSITSRDSGGDESDFSPPIEIVSF